MSEDLLRSAARLRSELVELARVAARIVVRNVYTLELDPSRIEPLVKRIPTLFAQVNAELLAMAALLEQQA